MLNLSEGQRKWHSYYPLLHQFVGKHKLGIWSSMFLSVMIIGALALVGLLDAGFDPTDLYHNSSSTALDAGESAVGSAASQPPKNVSSPRGKAAGLKLLLVLGASATGGWFITYKLKHAGKQPASPSQRVKRKVGSQAKIARSKTTKAKRRLSEPMAAPAPRPSALQPSVRKQRSRSPQLPASAQHPVRLQPLEAIATEPLLVPTRAFEPQVTVVPAETLVSLDRREPTLAEVLDLRKRRTIASMMEGITSAR